MKNIVFKNHIVNIIIGIILIAFTITAYFMEWYKDFLGIIVGVVLLGLSLKRFLYSFKKIIGKNATLILVLEIVLDIVFCGLLFYYQQHIQIYAGLVLYIRGVAYLIINYITTRKIKLVQYLMNIMYITLGAFFMFTALDFIQYLEIGVAVFVLILGAFFLYFGIDDTMKNKKKKNITKKVEEKYVPTPVKLEEKKVEPVVAKPEAVKPEVVKPKIDYSKLTVAELKVVAKEKNIVNYSALTKQDLIDKINKSKEV